MIDEQNFFDQPAQNDLRTYENISKIAAGQSGGYITGSLLDYLYFKENQKLIAIELSQIQALDADPKAIQQTDFTGNIERDGVTTRFLILEVFPQGPVRVLSIYFALV